MIVGDDKRDEFMQLLFFSCRMFMITTTICRRLLRRLSCENVSLLAGWQTCA